MLLEKQSALNIFRTAKQDLMLLNKKKKWTGWGLFGKRGPVVVNNTDDKLCQWLSPVLRERLLRFTPRCMGAGTKTIPS